VIKMKIICDTCGRDINAIGQDNCSYIAGSPMCEDCYGELRASGLRDRNIETIWDDGDI
jgi:hypothetical protein